MKMKLVWKMMIDYSIQFVPVILLDYFQMLPKVLVENYGDDVFVMNSWKYLMY